MAATKSHLFVYGTLMQQMNNPFAIRLATMAALVGPATAQGRLFHHPQNYPCAVCSPDRHDRIHGQVYRMEDPEACFEFLDPYEDCDMNQLSQSLFIRTQTSVDMGHGLSVLSWMYFWNRPLNGMLPIDSGCFTSIRG